MVGGGFVGVCSALAFQQRGQSLGCWGGVKLFESGPAGGAQACSWGNAGTFAPYACLPVTGPSVVRSLPSLLGDSNGPLRLARGIDGALGLLGAVPWLVRTLLECSQANHEHTVTQLAAMLAKSEAAWDRVLEYARIDPDAVIVGSNGPPLVSRKGYLLLQDAPGCDVHSGKSRRNLERRVDALFQAGSRLRCEVLDESGVLELEPGLSSEAARGGAHFFPDAWQLSDPAIMLDRLLKAAVERGVEVISGDDQGHVTSLAFPNGADGDVVLGTRDGREHEAYMAVVCAGAHSHQLAVDGGEQGVSLSTERGYSITFERGALGDAGALNRAVGSAAGGFILTPMSKGLRCAGLVELGGTRAGPYGQRWAQLERMTRLYVADDPGARKKEMDWMGFRPTCPDYLPVLGRSRSHPGLFYNFGHQHIGFTAAAVSAEEVCHLADHAAHTLDLAHYWPSRF